MREHDVPGAPGNGCKRVSPVAGKFVRLDQDIGEDGVLHECDDVGFGAYVVVQRHRCRSEPGRDALHGDGLEPFGVRNGDGRTRDLVAAESWFAPGWFRAHPDERAFDVFCHSYHVRLYYSYVVRLRLQPKGPP